ncbi:hypothetical protein GSI_12587 [Ganoderma sinense ZZ0214-1]|uniref:SUN domain-containing protein n=1 Tax=Ganoderma sinense ZZ0214-1 TaxID=1077348 RepID=A0A2G8RT66_9APHY|nr:hypothetical protein GSI_12587 [Ganoderma sinense ZZ0214-1]
MADPFNPRRFFYETNSQSDRLANADPQTPRRAEAFRPSQDGSVLRLRSGPPTSTVPQPGIGTQLIQRHVEPINPSDRHTDTRSGRRDLLIPLCVAVVAVVAVSCYFGIRALECFPHPTPFASLSPDVQAYVDQAILRISRDPVRRPDFALYANGGRVIPELTGIVRDDVLVLPSTDNSPNLSLSDDPRIGSCWKFPQDAGQLGFRTSEILFPTHVTIDHIPIDVAVDIGQAPRSMVLWGWSMEEATSEHFTTYWGTRLRIPMFLPSPPAQRHPLPPI